MFGPRVARTVRMFGSRKRGYIPHAQVRKISRKCWRRERAEIPAVMTRTKTAQPIRPYTLTRCSEGYCKGVG
eukprot:5926821-Prymnesium_polylepis.1